MSEKRKFEKWLKNEKLLFISFSVYDKELNSEKVYKEMNKFIDGTNRNKPRIEVFT